MRLGLHLGLDCLLSFAGLSMKSLMSMSSSVSGFNHSIDPGLFSGYGELDLGKGVCWTMWASHFVSFPNKFLVLSRKSLSAIFKIGIGTGSSGGMFSLSECASLGHPRFCVCM